MLAGGAELDEKEVLRSKFKKYHQEAGVFLKELALTDVRDVSSWSTIVTRFLSAS
jgi:hypothetical protein